MRNSAAGPYLKSLVGVLTRGNVSAAWRDLDDGDVVVVSPEESLLPLDDVPDDHGAAQWEDQVLVVRVQDQAAADAALEADHGLQVELFLRRHFCLLYSIAILICTLTKPSSPFD